MEVVKAGFLEGVGRGAGQELGLREGRLSEGNALSGCSQARSCSVTLMNGEQRGWAVSAPEEWRGSTWAKLSS